MDRISWWRTSFGEAEARRIGDAIVHEHISQGPVTEEFERQLAAFLGVPYVLATTSGSVAELLALLALGVGPGDEVIVPNRTWIATAHAPMILGARAVLIDVEPKRPIIDPSQIERAITPRTKAIVPVHLNGRSADMAAIRQVAEKHGLRVVEDAAQALGSRNSAGLLGTQSDIGFFSLSVAKIIATGQGGFVATRDERLYESIRLVRTHGVSDVIHAQWTRLGFNFRFNDILAAIGLEQLKRLPERIEALKAVYARYAAAMPEIPFLRWIPVDVASGEIPIYIEVLCRERDRLMAHLEEHGIQCRPFYPDLDCAGYLQSKGDFPHSRVYGHSGIFLPSGPAQPLENVDRVIDVLRRFKGKDWLPHE
jgi:perosamine synthetase